MFTLPFISIVDCDVFVENPISPTTGEWISTLTDDDTITIKKIEFIGKKMCCGDDETFDTIEVLEIPFDFDFDSTTCEDCTVGDQSHILTVTAGTTTNVDSDVAYVWKLLRSSSTIWTASGTTATICGIDRLSGTNERLANGDILSLTVTLDNGVTVTTSKTVDSSSSIQDCFVTFVADSKVVTFTTPYTISNNLIKVDTDTYAFEDGVWTLGYVITYDQNSQEYTYNSDKCYLIDCDTTCEFAQDSVKLLKEDKDFFIEIGLVKQALDAAISCQHCCEACDLFEFYSTAINYGKLSPCNC